MCGNNVVGGGDPANGAAGGVAGGAASDGVGGGGAASGVAGAVQHRCHWVCSYIAFEHRIASCWFKHVGGSYWKREEERELL